MNQSKDGQAELARALELHRLGRLPEAEGIYETLRTRQPDNADASHLLGVLLTQTGRVDRAVPLLEHAARLEPEQPEVHANLARAHHALGHVHDALPVMRRASALAPESAQLLCDLGALLQDSGELAEARRSYEAALVLEPAHRTGRYNLASVTHRQGHTAHAAEILHPLVRECPQHAVFRTTLAGYQLELDRIEEALGNCDAVLQSSPRDLMAMTLMSVALLRLGRRDDARSLLDLDRLVVSRTVQAPAGFPHLAAFNAALESHILSHPTLVTEREGNATRHGQHTDNLLLDRDLGPMAALEAIFHAGVTAYLDGLPTDSRHPFLTRRPERWRLQAWAVVMHAQGHQLAHTHPDGWVSGVYYAATPPEIRDDDDSHAGWIEFGRPLPELIKHTAPITRLLRPQEGTLVLFPSFLYHETIAFDSTAHRISIAFDAVPHWRAPAHDPAHHSPRC